jgi:hypothetical protein
VRCPVRIPVRCPVRCPVRSVREPQGDNQSVAKRNRLELDLTVYFPKTATEHRCTRVLIDSGAAVSLVRHNVPPDDAWVAANHPRKLVAVNGQQLPGGERGSVGVLKFKGVSGKEIRHPCWLFEGHIGPDIILGYPFLRAARADLVAHRNCLKFPAGWVCARPPSKTLPMDEVQTQALPRVTDTTTAGQSLQHHTDGHAGPKGKSGSHPNPEESPSKLWKSHTYTVVREQFDLAVQWSRFSPRIDTFATQANARCPHWWTVEQDAFLQDWGRCGAMWQNPPFEAIARCIAKIKADGAHGLMCIPVWKTAPWWGDAMALARREREFPKEVWLYQNARGVLMPQRWWASTVLEFDERRKWKSAPYIHDEVRSVGLSPTDLRDAWEGWCGSQPPYEVLVQLVAELSTSPSSPERESRHDAGAVECSCPPVTEGVECSCPPQCVAPVECPVVECPNPM